MLNKEKSVKIILDKDKCTRCGICINACSGEYLSICDNEIIANENSLFGCIQCGRCMMSCPNNAIVIEGEGIGKENLVELPTDNADYGQLYSLLIKRRSARKFQEQEVALEHIEKILQAASTGAISIPPYEVKVLVINGKNKVQELAEDLTNSFSKMLKIFNPVLLWLFKPILGANNYKLFKEFVIPLIKTTIKERLSGNDILFYDAPCVLIFYTTAICDKEDAIIAATLATTAAESLGLGTCIIGSVPPAINNNCKIKNKYGIAKSEKAVMAFILGHAKETFSKGIKRDFKEVRYF